MLERWRSESPEQPKNEQEKEPRDVAYAHLSIAFCYLSQRKLKEAIPPLEAAIKVPNCPADLKKQAEQILAQVKAAGGQ